MTELLTLHIAGVVAMLGAAFYTAGDVLLLAPTVGPSDERRPFPIDVSADRILRRRATLLADLARLPSWRLRWGALCGVIGGPLMLAGMWLFYRSVHPAGPWWTLPPTMLFLAATVAAPFVHGSFCYIGETTQILYAVDETRRPVVAGILRRQIVTLMMAYGPVIVAMIVASIWGSLAVENGLTRLPVWMSAVNPVTLTIAWLLLKKILPKRVGEALQGAGFSIANLVWFAAMTGSVQ